MIALNTLKIRIKKINVKKFVYQIPIIFFYRINLINIVREFNPILLMLKVNINIVKL